VSKVVLVPHQKSWAEQFAILKQEMSELLGRHLVCLEHFGSTSFQEIVAKPIIDITGMVKDLDKFDEFLASNLPSHMKNYGENGVTGRRYLVVLDGEGNPRSHVHLFANGSSQFHDRIRLRDYLRNNPEALREYETLKRDLAGRFKDDPVAYWEGKVPFIRAMLAKAR
jgi:GrpB-like predicted nucleotidyltransferase (UPF0157 family)